MSEFRFRHFSVTNEKSAMKVNTDGVLLGAAMTLRPSDRRLLDIGTGTGTIALMAAQRLSGLAGPQGWKITAVDIDHDSAAEAGENFARSPWSAALEAVEAPLSLYDSQLTALSASQSIDSQTGCVQGSEGCGAAAQSYFDLIFSNPPYFDDSLQAPVQRRNDARHTMSLSYREILEFASRRLAEGGRVAMVLPSDLEKAVLREARSRGLNLFRILRIRTVERKKPSRMIVEFSGVRTAPSEIRDDTLTLLEGGNPTAAYRALTEEFYIR